MSQSTCPSSQSDPGHRAARRNRRPFRRDRATFLALRSSDKAAHDRMPVVMAQAGDAAAGWVVGALQDLVGWYLDPLALEGDPIAACGIRLVVGHLTIARR